MLAFTSVYFLGSSLFNGLRPIGVKNFSLSRAHSLGIILPPLYRAVVLALRSPRLDITIVTINTEFIHMQSSVRQNLCRPNPISNFKNPRFRNIPFARTVPVVSIHSISCEISSYPAVAPTYCLTSNIIASYRPTSISTKIGYGKRLSSNTCDTQ
jgi:hypothetical protein